MEIVNERAHNILLHQGQLYYRTKKGKLQKKCVDKMHSLLREMYNDNEHIIFKCGPNNGKQWKYCWKILYIRLLLLVIAFKNSLLNVANIRIAEASELKSLAAQFLKSGMKTSQILTEIAGIAVAVRNGWHRYLKGLIKL